MDNYQGKLLNAPNDVAAVHADGSIWFTDPGYGILLNYEGHKAEFDKPLMSIASTPTVAKRPWCWKGSIAPMASASRPIFPSSTWSIPAAMHSSRVQSQSMSLMSQSDGKLTNGRLFVDMSPGNSDGIRQT
ncbi:MAG: hypothetical protein R2867_17465 [Caldilineaceae bacterium]